ncbi:MAG: 2-oxoglutarate dehydrogenase complex dihydrolipoyllysine-residue succinyltransferase [Cytophagales bacterium]|nr:2-oxoglutarate dehydrogenase complex dihydrolipoyllysine-residue succinyltransferase [Cytophagales bacterium]MDW8383852.1 2-oxoglutarate dehydrogenase complex dihydrolipoyllysine-residue succinyltransferase [Flammeovirgaceae bacterium]
MSFTVRVPAVGESITEVTVATWNKKDGDFVQKDDVLCDLESDKATFELRAETSGILRIVAKAGDTVPIGAIICTIEEAKTTNAPQKSASPLTPTKPEIIEMTVPAVGESITEVTVGAWNKKDGEFVQKGDVLCEIESDKATFDLQAEQNGVLQIVAKSGTTLKIGSILCRILVNGTPTSESASVSQPAASAAQEKNYATGHASPAAAKILAEKGIEASAISGTGVGGRITKEDALKAEKVEKTISFEQSSTDSSAETSKTTAGTRTEHRQKMSSMRKTIAKRLVAVKNETAMLTTFNEVDMKAIVEIRTKYKDKFKEKYGVNLGFMSFFTKACTIALREFPAVNAQIQGDEIVFADYVDISVAVSTPKGLVVPVLRNTETMTLDQIEKEIARLAAKARDGKLTIPEMTGGTFTITNGGVFGSMLSTPIINAPQSAILGMHNIVERPVAINGQVEIRPIMYVALSYDHRIIDGRESVSFLVRVKQLLEDPIRMMLEI